MARRFEIYGVVAFGARRAQGRRAVRHEFVRLFAPTAAIQHCLISLWAGGGGRVARCEFSFYRQPALLAA